MSQLNESTSLKSKLLRTLQDLKQDRIKAEEQANFLKNKIFSLKLRQKNSEKKIQNFKALTKKITEARQLKSEISQKAENQKKQQEEQLLTQYKNIKAQTARSYTCKQENCKRIYLKNKDSYVSIKDRKRFEEALIRQQFRDKLEENSFIKKEISEMKEARLNERNRIRDQKIMENRELYKKRISEENNLIYHKINQKKIMEDVDFAMIEYLHDGLLF
jgi:hypothetical protein